MKELQHSSPDGSRYYGNGVWGPSALDIQRANLSFNEKPKTKEEPNNDLLFVSQESVLGRLLQITSKVKLPAKFAIPGSMATVLLVGACGGVGNKNTQEPENKESSGYALPFPEGETWFLTNGPHADGYSLGVKYAIDIAPPELGRLNGNCPTDGSRLSIDNRVVTASASGKVTAKGDDNNRNDPHHSEIRIKRKNGLTQVYIHLDNTQVRLGDEVNQGDPLGNPSCEFPPGGGNSGPHVHIGLMKDRKALPIDGVVVGGWTIHNGADGKDGTMTKPGETTRTANTGRHGNDLPNNPNKAVVASPKDPIPPISGSIKEKSVSPTPTSKKDIPTIPLPCQVTTDPALNNLVAGEMKTITANVTSGLEEAKISKMRFGSYNTEVATVNPTSDSTSPYSTTVVAIKDGFTAIWGTADLSDGRICQSSGTTDTDIKISALETKKPAPTVEKQIEKKISISKKPDELYRALLTNSISSNILPQGMSSRGASAGQIDETGKALKQIGAVTIAIEDSSSEALKGYPTGGISYSIFPDSPTAKSASELVGTHLQNGRALNEFPYPAKIYSVQSLFNVTAVVVITSADNVMVVTSFAGTDANLLQLRTIDLAKAAIEHLGKVGR